MEEDGRRCHVHPDHCALSLIAPPLAHAQDIANPRVVLDPTTLSPSCWGRAKLPCRWGRTTGSTVGGSQRLECFSLSVYDLHWKIYHFVLSHMWIRLCIGFDFAYAPTAGNSLMPHGTHLHKEPKGAHTPSLMSDEHSGAITEQVLIMHEASSSK
jgi:hypothetical protein